MAKKKTGLSQTLFGEINPYATTTEIPPEITAVSQPVTFPLEAIRPDPGQPRQLLPAELSMAITSGALSPPAALAAWLNQAEQDTSDSALKRHVYELRRLATSIEQHGLINPITLRRPRPEESLAPEVEYLIVTGERRYWSHVLLALEKRQVHDGAEVGSPEQIKALLSNEGISIRAHQLIENLIREDINAVEKARGMWALRYELSGVNHGSPLASTPGQVNHGSPSQDRAEEILVPWSQVEEMLDISKRYRIFVTSVLNLNEEAQQLVVRHNLSERLIRPIVQKLKERPELQVEVLKRLITHREAGDNEPDQPAAELVGGLVEQFLARVTAGDTPGSAPVHKAAPVGKRLTSGAEQFRSRVQGALRFLNQLEEPDLVGLTQDLATTQEYTHVVEELRDLRERIDTILEAVNIYSSQHS